MTAKAHMGATALLFAAMCVCPPPAFADDASEVSEQLRTLVGIYSILDQESAERPDPRVGFYEGGIPAMLRTLDQHSNFFDPSRFAQLQQSQQSESQGFGATVSVLPGRVMVLQTLQGTPAARVGLNGGDEIVAINGIELAYLDVDQLRGLLEDARQRQVVLHVRHPGSARIVDMTMSPELFEEPSVSGAFEIAPGVGYLRVIDFEAETGGLIRSAIEKLGGEYLRGLILDLRNNPGGAIAAALDTASLFLAPDQLVYSIKGRHMEAEDAYVPRSSTPYTFPVVVLMNGSSASASEIVAGALQDHDRALIVGEPSYGKGLVQQVFPLAGETAMTLTVAFYYTPSGRSIQKPLSGGQLASATRVASGPFRSDSGRTLAGGGGIQPDQVVVEGPRTQLQLALEATGLLTAFAGNYLRSHNLADNFEVDASLLEDLREFLVENQILPNANEWNADREWVSSRLRRELVNLGFGVARGDEIGLPDDPVVQEALRQLRGGF